ncbi:hypothetical protein GCM10017600_39290 [Streptosporangium carneum]|uniref:Uncharacterized protein n=1 Tax=Streptosporangium carneum TaxID=47481 RepID=A0A9W6I3I2_9ACTN|nr:hypothetical protein GCM10017600_39290 [Streptosporangium carneum]
MVDLLPSLSSGKDRGHIGHLTVSHHESAGPSLSTATALVGRLPGLVWRPSTRLCAPRRVKPFNSSVSDVSMGGAARTPRTQAADLCPE